MLLVSTPTYHTKRALKPYDNAYEDSYGDKAPMPSNYLREMLYLILTKKLVPILRYQLPTNPWNSHRNKDGRRFCKHLQSCIKPLFWKRYIDECVFAMEHKSRQNRELCGKGKYFHCRIKDSELKCQKQRSCFWTQSCTKRLDSTRNQP